MSAFEPQLTKRYDVKDGHTLKVFLETGGYASLKKLFTLTPEQVTEEVKTSGRIPRTAPVSQALASASRAG